MNHTLLTLIFSFHITLTLASWSPPIHNYTTSNSNAGRQNWGIEQGVNGWVYFANNDGLVEFNGSIGISTRWIIAR